MNEHPCRRCFVYGFGIRPADPGDPAGHLRVKEKENEVTQKECSA